MHSCSVVGSRRVWGYMTEWLFVLTVVLTPGEGLCCVVVVCGLLCFEHCQLEGMPLLAFPVMGLVICCVLCCGNEQLSMLDGLPEGMAVILVGKVCVWVCHAGQVILEGWWELMCGWEWSIVLSWWVWVWG